MTRTAVALLAWIVTVGPAWAADTPFVKDLVTVNRLALHGPFNAPKFVFHYPSPVKIPLLPTPVADSAGDDFRAEVIGRENIPPTTEGEGTVVAKADPGTLGVMPTSWDVDGSTGLQALDMQIAASHSHLVLSSVHTIAFFDKGGNAQAHMSLADFFALVRADMNSKVLDPKTGVVLAAPYLIDEFYDARVVFDAHRKRFWVGCLARNSEAKYGNEPDHTAHRVTKFALAVSKTENPNDGFISYWWDPVFDYPFMGVSERLVSVGLGGEVVAVVAQDLANGIATPAYDIKNFTHADGTPAGERLIPALQHGVSTGNAQFVVSTYQSTLTVWGIDQTDPTQVWKAGVPVAAFQAPQKADQSGNADIPHPHQIEMTNVGNLVMKAVHRDGKLYAVWHDARKWSGASSPITALRLERLDVSPYPDHVAAAGQIDRTFGKQSAADPANTLFSYYWPSLEVNRDGTMVVSYCRSGATIFPEIRYSIYRANDPDIESSHLFQPGEYPLGNEDADYTTRPDAAPTGRLDFTGSAVDPADDRTVWIFLPYSVKASVGSGAYKLRVGRIHLQP